MVKQSLSQSFWRQDDDGQHLPLGLLEYDWPSARLLSRTLGPKFNSQGIVFVFVQLCFAVLRVFGAFNRSCCSDVEVRLQARGRFEKLVYHKNRLRACLRIAATLLEEELGYHVVLQHRTASFMESLRQLAGCAEGEGTGILGREPDGVPQTVRGNTVRPCSAEARCHVALDSPLGRNEQLGPC